MSLEYDITGLKKTIEAGVDESIKTARELYLDTNKIAKTPFNRLIQLDPSIEVSPEGKPYGGKYAEWMVRTYVKNNMHYGDISKFGVIKDFDELCKKNKIPQKDINQYATVEQLYDEVKKYEDVKTQGEIERVVKQEGANIIYETDDVIVVQPTTREASCYYGKGTKWCTAGDVYNYFNDYFYHKGVNLYYVVPKNGDNDSKIAVAVYPDGSKEYYNAKDGHMNAETAKTKIQALGVKEKSSKVKAAKT